MHEVIYLQDTWIANTCYGCGSSNSEGLRLKSRWSNDGQSVVAEYLVDAKYNSGMPDVMYGGAIASLIDCHSVWTATAFAYKAENRNVGSDPLIFYITGKLSVTFVKPTPISRPLHIKAWVDGGIGKKVNVICELGPQQDITATGLVTAIRVV